MKLNYFRLHPIHLNILFFGCLLGYRLNRDKYNGFRTTFFIRFAVQSGNLKFEKNLKKMFELYVPPGVRFI